MKFAILTLIVTVLLASCATIPSLIDATEKGQIEKVKTLLDSGADVNAKDTNGRTASIGGSIRGNIVSDSELCRIPSRLI